MKTRMTIAILSTLAACRQGVDPAEANLAGANDVVANSADNGAMPKAASSAPAVPGRVTQFTPLDPETCKLVEENKAEGPYWRRRCDGAGGYAVEWTESDLRQGLEIIAPGGRKTSIDLSGKIAKGAFNALGPRIEWRGETGEKPDAMIVRVNVARPEGGPDRSVLAVATLAPTPCLIGAVEPGHAQNARAQALADQGGSCL